MEVDKQNLKLSRDAKLIDLICRFDKKKTSCYKVVNLFNRVVKWVVI